MNDDGCIVTSNYGHDLQDIIGKFEVNKTNPGAMVLWDLFRKNPTAFEFAVAYAEDAEGHQELMEVSIVPKAKRE